MGGAIYAWTGVISRAEPSPSTAHSRAGAAKWRSPGTPNRQGGRRAAAFPAARHDATDTLLPNALGTVNDHRTAHLEYAERPQDQRCARGNGAALQGRSGQYQQGRADDALVSGHQPE